MRVKESQEAMRDKRTKRNHEMSLTSGIKENPKAFYTFIKNEWVTRERFGPLEDKGGTLLESENVGEVLNKYFALKFPK